MPSVKQTTVFNPDAGQAPTGAVCIPNISTEERRKRLGFGVVAFVVAIVILAFLMVSGANHGWRLLLFLPLAGAATGFFQWSDKTCVALSARQSRKLGDQMEKIEDAAELAQVQRQAQRVQMKIFVTAIVLTLMVLALP